MHLDHPALLPLICPTCRKVSERGRELWTVSLEQVFRSELDGEVIEGTLRCDNRSCQKSYPIFDGIPLLVRDPAALLVAQPAALTAPVHPGLFDSLVSGASDNAPLARLLEHLSIYLDAHFGDLSQPPPDGPAEIWGGQALFSTIESRAVRPVGRAVELGCSVGRGLFELAKGAELVVGVDLQLGALRAARRLLRGEPLDFARRSIGRHYGAARITPPSPRPQRVALICGDALDPPLAPNSFDRIVALNMLDSVRWPRQLLAVVDGLCAPEGELLLASPYFWQSEVVEESERIGAEDPAGELRRILCGGPAQGSGLEAAYAIELELELLWELRRDARSSHRYQVHTLLSRKLPTDAAQPKESLPFSSTSAR